MPYQPPRLAVYRQFEQVPQAVGEPRSVLLIGGNANVKSFVNESDRPRIALGDYEADESQTYNWPGKTSGALPDTETTKLVLSRAELGLFETSTGTVDTDKPTRLRFDGLTLANSTSVDGTAYSRDPSLPRDVRVGDLVRVGEFKSRVVGLIPDVVAGDVEDATDDDANADATIEDETVTRTDGMGGSAPNLAVSNNSYNGRKYGRVTDTYVVTVTKASTGNDATTARVMWQNSDGSHRSQGSVAPDAGGAVTISGRGSIALTLNVGTNNAAVGHKWDVQVSQNHTPATATSGGTYNNFVSKTYTVEVVEGGVPGTDSPKIYAASLDGTERTGPTNVTATDTPVAIGNSGVEIEFDGALVKGDRYYVQTVGKRDGAVQTLTLANLVPSGLRGQSDLDVELLATAAYVELSEGPNAYTVLGRDEGIRVESGLRVEEPGSTLTLPVRSADLFLNYREWLPTLADNPTLVYANDDADVPGPIDPLNPLKFGLSRVEAAAAGAPVVVLAVRDPDSLASWDRAIELAEERKDVREVVVLTTNRAVQEAAAASVASLASPDVGSWRFLWVAPEIPENKGLVRDVTGTITRAAGDTDGPYTTVTVDGGEFMTNGVKAGDELRYAYGFDADGRETYKTATVKEVTNEDVLVLASPGPSQPVSTARRVEVWRPLAGDDLAAEVAANVAGFGSDYVRAVVVNSAQSAYGPEFVAGALAGQRSGLAPHKPMTGEDVPGVSEAVGLKPLFTRSQLNVIGEAGGWVVTRNDDGAVKTRHGLTTAGFGSVLAGEESVVSNQISIMHGVREALKDIPGRANITDQLLATVRLMAFNVLVARQRAENVLIGPQVREFSIGRVYQDPVFKDRMIIEIDIVLPAPANQVNAFLRFSV